MKKLLNLLVLSMFFLPLEVFSDKKSDRIFVSFFDIISSQEMFENKIVEVSGYLISDDERFFLCINMESCFSGGKERLILIMPDAVNLKDKYKEAMKCHVKLNGVYQGVPDGQKYIFNYIGYLKVIEPPEFQLSRGYIEVNKNCKIYSKIFSDNGNNIREGF